ncbi:hypothetical protein DFH08DRAFT_705973, partial [Mycena albidolilacea]
KLICAFVYKNFPNIILIYVPGNLTSIFQLQDMGIQRITKHRLCQPQLNYLVRCYEEQISEGITPENIKLSNSYPILHDAFIHTCVDLYDWLLSDIIKRSWEMCVVD